MKENIGKKSDIIPLEMVVRNYCCRKHGTKIRRRRGLKSPVTIFYLLQKDELGDPLSMIITPIFLGAATKEELDRNVGFELTKNQ